MTVADMREQVERELKAQQPSEKKAAAAAGDPKTKRDYHFDLDFTDPRGVRWVGGFTDRVPNVGQRQKIAILQSKFNGNLPIDTVAPEIALLNWAIAYMAFSLTELPEWAKDMLSIDDPTVIWALWDEVASHEATFRGPGKAANAGEAGG